MATIGAGDAFTQFELLMREFISPSVHDLELADDDPAWSLMNTMQPMSTAGRATGLAGGTEGDAEFVANYRIKVQRAGRVTGGTLAGNTTVQMGVDAHLHMAQAASAKYLDPTKTPQRSYLPIRLVLKRILGSITLNHTQVVAEMATEPIDEIASGQVEDVVSRLRGYITNYFYGSGSGASIAQVVGNPTDVSESTIVELTLDAGGFGRFMNGDRLHIAEDSSGISTQRPGNIDGVVRVVNIDTKDRTIFVQAEAGEGTIVIGDNDHLIPVGAFDFATTTDFSPNGIEAYLLDTGDYPGTSSITVEEHGYLRSFVTTNSTFEDPTMDKLAQDIDFILDTGFQPPSVAIAERGVWTLQAQLDREANAHMTVPAGSVYPAAGGIAGPRLQHQEHVMQKLNSIRVRPNSIVGLSPETWVKFMPMGDRTIHWVYGNGPLAGFNSIFGPVYSGNQLTELADAPFNSYIEFGCLNPRRNFRRVGVNAQRNI